MPKTRAPYPAEYRQQIIELAQAGRSPAELSREFGPTIQTILNRLAKAARDAGKPLPARRVRPRRSRPQQADCPPDATGQDSWCQPAGAASP